MKIFKFLIAAVAVVMLASCDSNKGKVSDMAKQFVEAVQNKDKVTIYELYPNSRAFSNLQLTDSIISKDIDVEYSKEDSVYMAKLNDNQALIVKVEKDSTTNEDKLVICDSYNVLKLDSACYDLAAKVGAPVKKNSDMLNGELFDNDSEFIAYLSEQYPSAANGNLYTDGGRYSWTGGWSPTLTIMQPITNGGETAVKGEDYSVEFTFFARDTDQQVGTYVQNGWDLAAGETQVMTYFKNDLLYYKNNLYWNINFNFKNASTATLLDKYGSFTGKEYEDFLKAQSEQKTEKKDGKKEDSTPEEQVEENPE